MAKPSAPSPPRGPPPPQHLGERRGSNFGQNEKAERDAGLTNHPSETEEKWSIGSKFKPAAPERENSGSFGRKFHNGRPGFGDRGQSGGDSGHGSPTLPTPSLSEDNTDWRAGPRKVAPPSAPISRQGSQESPGKALTISFPCCATDCQVQSAHLCGARSNSCQDRLTLPLYPRLLLRLRMLVVLNPVP